MFRSHRDRYPRGNHKWFDPGLIRAAEVGGCYTFISLGGEGPISAYRGRPGGGAFRIQPRLPRR
jgi:hypothetical protein